MQEWSYCCPAGDEGGKVPLQVANVLWYETMLRSADPPPPNTHPQIEALNKREHYNGNTVAY
jgi:hypothetical protein